MRIIVDMPLTAAVEETETVPVGVSCFEVGIFVVNTAVAMQCACIVSSVPSRSTAKRPSLSCPGQTFITPSSSTLGDCRAWCVEICFDNRNRCSHCIPEDFLHGARIYWERQSELRFWWKVLYNGPAW